VENKITVELLRTSRYHSDDGCWGDQLTPMIKGVEGQNIDLDATIRILANNLHRMNESLRAAVEAGVTIELMRTSRFHSEAGSWGDQMTPILIQK
jgi:phage gp46-like protein